MKKKIISNTILFMVIFVFINLFKLIFGNENILVGVSIIVTTLVLLGHNLMKKPIFNFLFLVGINVILVIGAAISNQSIFLGLLINFLIVSWLCYFLSYNLTKALIVPFGLQYLFMLFSPVTSQALILRFIAVIVGSILIMGVQFFLFYNKSKTDQSIKSDIIEYLPDGSYYRKIKLFNKEYTYHIVRARYALTTAVLVSITTFISYYFNLPHGKWMVFTVFAVNELFSESCTVKSKQRLQGTVIGGIIVIASFLIVQDPTYRVLIMLLAGYLNSFASNYRDAVITVTISSVTAVAMTDGSILAVGERLMYVVIGIVLAVIVSHLVPRQEIKDEQRMA